MANVPNDLEILPKITTAWLGCTSVTDRRQTDRRQHIANVNFSNVGTHLYSTKHTACSQHRCLLKTTETSSALQPVGTSQLVMGSTRHTVKSCDELTVMSDGIVTSWPSTCCIQELHHGRWLRYCTRCNNLPCCTCATSFLSSFHAHK